MAALITYDLEPIANVVSDPGIIIAGKDSLFKAVEDFLKVVEENPGKITAWNPGMGGDDLFTTPHLPEDARAEGPDDPLRWG